MTADWFVPYLIASVTAAVGWSIAVTLGFKYQSMRKAYQLERNARERLWRILTGATPRAKARKWDEVKASRTKPRTEIHRGEG